MESDKIKEKIEDSKAIGYCLKDKDGRVLSQNNKCTALCGDQVSEICEGGCMALYKEEAGKEDKTGTQLFRAQNIGDEICDVILINDGEQLFTLLLTLKDKIASDITYFKKYGLSKRELEVVELVLKGLSNADIIKQLFISKSTLKTHLNKIYKKVPEHVIAVWRKK